MEKYYSLQQAFNIVSQYEGWRNLIKFRTVLEFNPKYKVITTGEGAGKRFKIPQKTLERFIQNEIGSN